MAHSDYISINLSEGLSVKSHFPVPCSCLELTRVVPCAKAVLELQSAPFLSSPYLPLPIHTYFC